MPNDSTIAKCGVCKGDINVGEEHKCRELELNPKQELFCQYYSTNVLGTRGNATQSYLKAYGERDEDEKEMTEDTAAVNGHRLLRNAKIISYLTELWKLSGLTDSEVDAELAGIVRQNKDLKSKLGSIKEYNRLRERGAEVHKIDVYEKYKDK